MTFETFVVSREEVSNPLLPELIRAAKTLNEHDLNRGVVSARYGNRVVLSTGPLEDLGTGDFVELVDFDPSRHVAMVIGTIAPPLSAPLHWLLYRRGDVNATVQLHRSFKAVPTADCSPDGGVEELLEALRLLKDTPCINLGDGDCIVIGGSIQAAMERIPCL